MAIYTKKEFAIECGITTKDLSNYIKRGKVVVANETIDSTSHVNKYFIEKRKEFNDKKNGLQSSPEEKKNKKSFENKNSEAQSKFDFPKNDHTNTTENYQLDTKLKSQDLEKSNIQILLLKAKLEKISGDSIPTELVKNLILTHSKSITIAFQNAADNLLMKIAKKKGLDRLEMADMRVEMVDIINTSVNDSIEESKKTVRNIVAEYSQKKEQGERE